MSGLIRVEDRELREALQRLRDTTGGLTHALAVPARRQMLLVETDARKAAPREQPGNVLQRSGRSEAEVSGNTIRAQVTFGGLASKYAEVQHENEDFAHTEAEYERKYGKPLTRTYWTRQTLRGSVGKRGKLTVRSKVWRYKRKHPIRGYRGGHAHFLFGARNSAWNEAARDRLLRAVLAEAQDQYETALGRGQAD